MERRFGAGSDTARSGRDNESRSFRPIQGGDAAKAAEEAAVEGSAIPQRTFGISLRTVRGAKFELEKSPRGPGEAMPVGSESIRQESPVVSAEPVEVVNIEPAKKESASGITKNLFHKLFRS